MRYPKERKEAVLKKMMPPHNRTVPDLAREEGISEATLYIWRKEARSRGVLMPDGDSSPEGWSAQDKFNAVIESAALNEVELSEYCRKKGLYPQQLEQWRHACETANDWDREHNMRLKTEQRADRQRIRQLERELMRKEKALAEAAALIVLRKKAEAIWGVPEGE